MSEQINVSIEGHCDSRFSAVREAFEENYATRGEVGAAVCITVDGETVVDLWGGIADQKTGRAWDEDTVVVIFSCTKGATALCAHVLVSRGELDLDAPVADYWPEFAQNGKEGATVRMMLDHSVGVPSCRETLPDGACHDWDYMVERIAGETPEWRPGTRNGYHMMTFGWTVGELVRRVSNRSLGEFFRDEVAEPLGLDFWIGAPETVEPRIARIIGFRPAKGDPISPFASAIIKDRSSLQSRAFLNMGGFNPNQRDTHAAEIGGGGGIANARALAGMYAPLACGGSLGDVSLVDADTLATMGTTAVATHEDVTLLIGSRFSLGFMKSIDNRRAPNDATDSVLMSPAAFGHAGAGGSMGFADPESGMSFGYVMNRQGPGILVNERGQSLIDAAYRALGYRSNTAGVWIR